MQAGNYQFGQRIGVGGAGAVYRATGPDGHTVAIKIIPRESAQREARIGRELGSQASLGAELGFVPLLDAWSDERHTYLVMPLLEGGSLADRLRYGPLPLLQADDLALRLAWSLAQAHERGIVHRDLKPANILFDADDRAFIADLGLAKLYDGADGLSRTGELRGSIGYLAPEQATDAKRVGPPADVFSWGTVVFEAVTGRQAFPGQRPLDRLNQVFLANVPPLRELCPEASLALEEAVRWALQPRPGDRPAHAGILVEHLSALPAVAPTRSRRRSLVVIIVVVAVVIGIVALALRAATIERAPAPDPFATPSDRPTDASPAASPTPPAPSVPPDPELRRLQAGWPASAPLQPAALLGSRAGTLGEPILALGWNARGHLVGVGRTRVRTWDPERGAIETHPLDLPPTTAHKVALDASRHRLWVAGRTELQVWDLARGKLLGKLGRRVGSAQVAVAPSGRAAAFATRRELLVWAGGRALMWRRPHGQSKGVRIAALDADRVVVAGRDLRLIGPAGDLGQLALEAPIASVGLLTAHGDEIFGLDDEGHLLCWEASPLRQRYRRPVLPDLANRKARRPSSTYQRRSLTVAHGRVWLSHLGGPRSAGRLLGFDPATGALQEEHALDGADAVAPLRAGRWATTTNTGLSGRVSVWSQGKKRWPRDALSASGPLAVADSGAAAFTPGPPAVRWTRAGGTRLPGDRASRGGLRPLLEGGGYLCHAPNWDLLIWKDDATAPAHRWRRRTPSAPLVNRLRPLIALSNQRAVGYTLQTLGVRKGTTLTVSGQRNVLALFSATGVRDIVWKGLAPVAGAPDPDPDLVRLVTPDRFGTFSLPRGAWTSHQDLVGSKGGSAVFSPAGTSFARWPAGPQRRAVEVWAWSGSAPRLELHPPLTRGRLGKGSLALTDRLAVWCDAGRLTAWDLSAPGHPHSLPLGDLRAAEVQAARTGEVWVNTTSGSLVVLAPTQ